MKKQLSTAAHIFRKISLHIMSPLITSQNYCHLAHTTLAYRVQITLFDTFSLHVRILLSVTSQSLQTTLLWRVFLSLAQCRSGVKRSNLQV